MSQAEQREHATSDYTRSNSTEDSEAVRFSISSGRSASPMQHAADAGRFLIQRISRAKWANVLIASQASPSAR